MGSYWATWPGEPTAPPSLRDVLDASADVLRDLQATRWITRRPVGEILDKAIVYVIGLAVDEGGVRLSIRWGTRHNVRVEHNVPLDAVERWDPEQALS